MEVDVNTLPGLHSGFSCLSGSVILFVFCRSSARDQIVDLALS